MIFESQIIEFNVSLPVDYMIWICGFANAQGGRLYIGMCDNGEVCGVENVKKLMEDIPNKVRDTLGILVDVNLKEKVGVCLDTCHVFDGGYDIAGNLEKVLEQFDEIISISKLKVIHLNDSKNALGSKTHRHEQIGKGTIGLENLINITNNKYLKDLVFILETPQESLEGYAQEIKLIKSEHKD